MLPVGFNFGIFLETCGFSTGRQGKQNLPVPVIKLKSGELNTRKLASM